MSRIRDPEDPAEDRRIPMRHRHRQSVAHDSEREEEDRSPSLDPGMGVQGMEMEKDARETESPQEEDSPRRGEETEGGDSSLTNLRGGAGSQYSENDSLHSSTRQLATLLHPHSPVKPQLQLAPHRSSSSTQPDQYYPNTSNAYGYQPMQMRADGHSRAQAQSYDYPALATYDPMSHPPYTDDPSSSQSQSQSQTPSYHSHSQSQAQTHPGLSTMPMAWEYQYQQHPSQHQQQATGNVDRHGQHTMYPTGYIDTQEQIPSIPAPAPGPSQHQHHPHPLQQHPHPHAHAQDLNQQQQQFHAFPLVRDPYPHGTGGYAFSDPHPQGGGGGGQGQYLPSSSNTRSDQSYDPSGSTSGSGTGSITGSGSNTHYKERGTSFDSAIISTLTKKPITTSRLGLDPAAKQERRREQNRVAQRAFRARAKVREQERSDDVDDDNQNDDVFDAR